MSLCQVKKKLAEKYERKVRTSSSKPAKKRFNNKVRKYRIQMEKLGGC